MIPERSTDGDNDRDDSAMRIERQRARDWFAQEGHVARVTTNQSMKSETKMTLDQSILRSLRFTPLREALDLGGMIESVEDKNFVTPKISLENLGNCCAARFRNVQEDDCFRRGGHARRSL